MAELLADATPVDATLADATPAEADAVEVAVLDVDEVVAAAGDQPPPAAEDLPVDEAPAPKRRRRATSRPAGSPAV